jgi:hypothetical protein
LDTSKVEQKTIVSYCEGFEEILGVLNDHKPTIIVSPMMLKYIDDAVPKKSFMCAGRRVPGGSKFYTPLLNACDEQGIKYFNVHNVYVIVCTLPDILWGAADMESRGFTKGYSQNYEAPL